MMEMMAALVILIIVSALVFIGVTRYMRTAYQREMDETAKEIYIAAQNHLTVADSLGTFSGRSDGTADAVTGDSDTYYFVVPADSADLNNNRSVLNSMLPFGSIDGTVRDGGSYIIRYQRTSSTANILDVFYANPSGRYPYTFGNGDFYTLFSEDTYRTASNAEQNRADYGTDGAIIGYYGGEGAQGGSESVTVPKLQLVNAEKLYATITNVSAFTNNETLEIYITGNESKAVYGPYAISGGADTFFIDDVTTAGRHFAELNADTSMFANDKRFIPGEDITVQAFALSKNSTKIAKSAQRSTNSLFASVSTISADALSSSGSVTATSVGEALSNLAASAEYYAKVSNIRHLENMSEAVSGYDAEAITALGTKAPVAYEQTADLSWTSFRTSINSSDSANVRVYNLAGDSTAAGTFAPVTPSTSVAQVYRGYSHKISDVTVSGSFEPNGGIFGTLQSAQVSDLEIVNFNIGVRPANVGALVGEATNTTISGMLAHHDVTSSTYSVAGTASAGGLVGSMTGGQITRSAAAMLVQSSGSASGGLVGTASNTTISQSYAGGHTSEGAYSDSSFNVSADGYAGGLVGVANNSAITSCYSTCSATADTAGGLVGNMAAGSSLTNSFATGLTGGNVHGALVGNLAEGASLTQTSGYYPAYLHSVDLTAFAVGSDENFADATIAESNTGAYEATVAGVLTEAVPYDAWLGTTQLNMYPYKTIRQLAGLSDDSLNTGFTDHLKRHYGDWPSLEVALVNRR